MNSDGCSDLFGIGQSGHHVAEVRASAFGVERSPTMEDIESNQVVHDASDTEIVVFGQGVGHDAPKLVHLAFAFHKIFGVEYLKQGFGITAK